MARVISTKSQNIYVKDRPFKKIYDRECSEDQKAKEGLIPFPSNIQQLMVRILISYPLYVNMASLISYAPYSMDHTVWTILYGPCHMRTLGCRSKGRRRLTSCS